VNALNEPTFEFTVLSVRGIVALPVPSKVGEVPVASVETDIVRPVANAVAVLALPFNAPTNVVDVTEVKPANVVDVEPNGNDVEPTVIELFVNAPLGTLVRPAPEPAKPVAVTIPVLGFIVNFVLDTFSGLLPLTESTQVIYFVPFVDVSSVILALLEFVAVVDVVALPLNAPVNVVAVTPVNPIIEAVVPPNATLVEPIVTELFVNAPFGIPVKLVPVNVGVFVQLGVAPDISTWLDVPAAKNAVAAVAD